MGVIVLLACLTTSVGLITACGEYFKKLIPALSYRAWVTVFSVISFGIALFGLTTIITAAIPVLMFLYPLTISLISSPSAITSSAGNAASTPAPPFAP